jgi:DNA-binding transcriptional MerR regulator
MAVESIALTGRQVLALVERLEERRIPANTLDRWITSGLIEPSVRGGQRGGYDRHRLFSRSDAAKLRMIARLHFDEGLSLQRIRLVFARVDNDPTLKAALLDPRTKAELIVTRSGRRTSAVIVRRGDDNDVEIPSGQVRLPLRDVVEGVETTARKLKTA